MSNSSASSSIVQSSSRGHAASASASASAASVPGSAMLYDAFLSYNWAHKPVVEAFATLLKERGVRVWMDDDKMTGYIKETIRSALANSRVVIAFLTRHYLASPICQEELRLASESPSSSLVLVRLEAPPFVPGGISRADVEARRESIRADIDRGVGKADALRTRVGEADVLRADLKDIEELLAYVDNYDKIAPILCRPGDHDLLHFDRAESKDWEPYARLWTAGGFFNFDRTAESLAHGDLQRARDSVDWRGRLLDVAFQPSSASGEERFDMFVQKHKLCIDDGYDLAPLLSPLDPTAVSLTIADKNAAMGILPSYIDADTVKDALELPPLPLSLCRFYVRQTAGPATGPASANSSVSGELKVTGRSKSSPNSWNDGAEKDDVEAYGTGSAAIHELANALDRTFHVVSGVAGAGKTCLLRVIAHCHGSSRKGVPKRYMEFNMGDFGDFRRVILLRLRDLERLFSSDGWKSVCKLQRASTTCKDAAAFCVANAYDMTPDAMHTRALADCLFNDVSKEALKTLWLLDGFDELSEVERAKAVALSRTVSVASSSGDRQHAMSRVACLRPTDVVHATLELLVSQRHVLITTRPAFAQSLGQQSYIRIEPLTRAAVVKFCSDALHSKPEEIEKLFKPALLEAMRTPVIMNMAIIAQLNREKASANNASASSTGTGYSSSVQTASFFPSSALPVSSDSLHPVTDLYYHIVNNMRNKFRGSAVQWESVVVHLRHLSLRGCARGEYSKFAWDSASTGTAADGASATAASKDDGLFPLVQAAGVVDVFTDGTIEFAHRSVQEFFAAQVISSSVASEKKLSDVESAALTASANDSLRRFVISTAKSLRDADCIVQLLWPDSTRASPSFNDKALEKLAQCIRFAPPHIVGSLACTEVVRKRAAAFWDGVQGNISNNFWVIADSLTSGALTAHRAVETLELYYRKYKLARWTKATNPYSHNFPAVEPPIAAIRVLLAVVDERISSDGPSTLHGPAAAALRELRAQPYRSPKQDIVACRMCSKPFSRFRWSHNCIRCGLVFCASCAPHRSVPDAPTGPQLRICSDCNSEYLSVDSGSHLLPFGLPRIAAALRITASVRIGVVRAPAIVALAVLGGTLGTEKDCLLTMACSATEDMDVRKMCFAELGARHSTDADVRAALSKMIALPSGTHAPNELVLAILSSFDAQSLLDDAVQSILIHPALELEDIGSSIAPRSLDAFIRRLNTTCADKSLELLHSAASSGSDSLAVFEKVCATLVSSPPSLASIERFLSKASTVANRPTSFARAVELLSSILLAHDSNGTHTSDPIAMAVIDFILSFTRDSLDSVTPALHNRISQAASTVFAVFAREPSQRHSVSLLKKGALKFLIGVVTRRRVLAAGTYEAAYRALGQVTTMDLERDSIGDAGARDLATVLPFLTALTTLDLSNNSIRDAGARDLATALPSLKALTTLYFGGNSIGAEGARDLATALPSMTALTTLDLGDNSIGDAGARDLATAFPSMTALTTLKLGGNNISDAGARDLATALPSLTALTTLNLGLNAIGDAGARDLATALHSLTALTALDLGGNSIGNAGARDLATALHSLTALTTLALKRNSFGDAGARDLATALPRVRIIK